jgi:hypothetical protein
MHVLDLFNDKERKFLNGGPLEEADGKQRMSRAAKGHEKYGKEGMAALAKAGREGAGEEKLDKIRDKHDKYNEGVAGPKDCWPGHRKVGTQPGTGRNAGKRVNDCEEIKKEDAPTPRMVDKDGNPVPHGARGKTMSQSTSPRELQPGDAYSTSKGVVTKTPTGIVHNKRSDLTPKPNFVEGMLDNPGEPDSPVAQAIVRRIMMQRTDLLAKHGPEKVSQAVDEVADFVGDVDEIGSSDVSGWVRHVEQMLGNMNEQGVAEGSEKTKPNKPMTWQQAYAHNDGESFDARQKRITQYEKSKGEKKPKHVDWDKKGGMQEGVAEGVAETLPLDDALKVLRHYGATNLKTTSNELHFYKNGRPFSVDLIWNDDATRSVSLSQLNSAGRKLKGQGVDEDISRRGFLRGMGAAALGAAGVGAASQAQGKVRFDANGNEIRADWKNFQGTAPAQGATATAASTAPPAAGSATAPARPTGAASSSTAASPSAASRAAAEKAADAAAKIRYSNPKFRQEFEPIENFYNQNKSRILANTRYSPNPDLAKRQQAEFVKMLIALDLEFAEKTNALLKQYGGLKEQGVAEATGDKPFDDMMKTIKKGTAKQATADRREQRKQSQQQARDAFGPNPAANLGIRKPPVSEGDTEQKPRIRKYTKMRPDGSKAIRYEVLDYTGRRAAGQGSEGFDDLKNAKQFYYRNRVNLVAPVDESTNDIPGNDTQIEPIGMKESSRYWCKNEKRWKDNK